MTLVINNLGKVIQTQFGITEIASAIAVGKVVGTIFTRQQDAAVFKPLSLKYGIHFTRLPPYLENVTLDRSGNLLGERQRVIRCDSKMPGIEVNSVDGIATFLVLIIRYVETPHDIVQYIEHLLKGDYYILNGGLLEQPDTESETSTLPYSLRLGCLLPFVNAVLDGDADSQQHYLCLQWMSELVQIVGSSNFLARSTTYARSDHQKLLRQLLGQKTFVVKKPKHYFHTLSAGSAMIALAAAANGANVKVQCMTKERTVVLPSQPRVKTTQEPFTVILWLMDVPDELKADIGGLGMTYSLLKNDPKARTLTLHGGAAEISRVIARQLQCSVTSEEAHTLWERGVAAGEAVSWEILINEILRGVLRFQVKETSLRTELPSQIGPLADQRYQTRRDDPRRQLSRKVAAIFHDVYQYNDYTVIDKVQFGRALDLITIAFGVGCSKSLISNPSSRLSFFSWCPFERPRGNEVDELTGLEAHLKFAENLVIPGISVENLLWHAACVWGGSDVAHHGHVTVHDKVVGIVCPQLTILLDVLIDPKRVATHGFSRGLMSIHEGSNPILPRDQATGYVLAGLSEAKDKRRVIPSQRDLDEIQEVEHQLIFTTEPYQADGYLSVVLCGWAAGEVDFQLNPKKVLHNLLSRSSGHDTVDMKGFGGTDSISRSVMATSSADRARLNGKHKPLSTAEWFNRLIHLKRKELSLLGNFFFDSCIGYMMLSGRPDWQVAAAGCIDVGNAILVTKEEHLENLQELIDLDESHPFIQLLILCCERISMS